MYTVTEQDVVAMGADIVTVGQMTTSISMYTLVALMANHQEVQQKAFMEIQQVIGGR